MITGLHPRSTSYDQDTLRQERNQRLALIAANGISLEDYQKCSFWKSDDNLVPRTFVLAVIAVENYGRPPLRRWLEETLARSDLTFFGKVPDYSLGIGQLKPSTARIVIEQTPLEGYSYAPDDSELLQLLTNPCDNLRLVHEYLDFLMRESGLTTFGEETANTILREYNGQQELEQEETYQDVVWKVFHLYQNSPTS